MHAYSFRLLCATAAFPLAAVPAAAKTYDVNSMSDFAIKTSDLPEGCSGLMKNYDTDQVFITCDTEQHFRMGFNISGGLQFHCDPPKDGKSVCTVAKKE